MLIQCKSSSILGQSLGWDAAAGAAAYMLKHAGIDFEKVAVTNQYFNGPAKEQAHLNGVNLLDCDAIEQMLKKHPVCRNLIA